MTSPQIVGVLSTAQNVLYIALAAKLWRDGLVSKYRLFAGYILLQLLFGVARLGVSQGTNEYAYFYFVSQPFLILGAFLAISEVYNLVLKDRPGIARMGRRVLPASVVVAVLLSGMTLFIRWSGEKSKSPFLEAYFTSEQFLYGSILLVVVLISTFLLWFPVPLSRNVVLHSCLFACYLLVQTIARMLTIAVGSDATGWINVTMMSVGLTCLIIWVLLLSPKGDKVIVKAGAPNWSPEQERRLLSQLDSINATLQNSVKK